MMNVLIGISIGQSRPIMWYPCENISGKRSRIFFKICVITATPMPISKLPKPLAIKKLSNTETLYQLSTLLLSHITTSVEQPITYSVSD